MSAGEATHGDETIRFPTLGSQSDSWLAELAHRIFNRGKIDVVRLVQRQRVFLC
jgi:hypothetical protein